MITITLNKIRAHSPCKSGWEKLLRYFGKAQADDEEFPLSVVIDSNGLDDALWCLRCLPEYDREWRLFAVWCARKVQHFMTDPRSIAAIDVAERYANGDSTNDELYAAWAAAEAAARTAARAATGDAAWAAPRSAARTAAEAAAWADAGASAWASAWASAGTAARAAARTAARASAWAAAEAAARSAAWAEQEAELRRIIS